MRKYILILTIVTIALLCGCAQKQEVKISSLDSIFSSSAFGFYIKDGDTFTPVAEMEEGDKLLWKTGDLKCPELTDKTQLVAVYGSNSEMPDEYYIEQYEDMGWTIGANISLGEDENSMWMSTTGICKGSHVESTLDDQDFDSVIELETVNEEKPYSNIDTDINILTGLEKNKYYECSIYEGTKNLHATICADTRAFKLIDKIELTNSPLKKTHNQYFVVNLPVNLKKGYYSINGEGLFKIT